MQVCHLFIAEDESLVAIDIQGMPTSLGHDLITNVNSYNAIDKWFNKIGLDSTQQIEHHFHAGNHFAEIIQGNRRKNIQLNKVQ